VNVNEIESFMSVVIGIFISDFDCHESILFNFKCKSQWNLQSDIP